MMLWLGIVIGNRWKVSLNLEAERVDDDDDEKEGPPLIGRPEEIELPELVIDDDDDDDGDRLGFR